MSMMLRRYAKSTGYARPWLYILFAVGFAVLAVWGGSQGQWLIAGFATGMALVCVIAVPVTRRLARGLAGSNEQLVDHR